MSTVKDVAAATARVVAIDPPPANRGCCGQAPIKAFAVLVLVILPASVFSGPFSQLERGEEKGVRAILDVVHGRELLFAVAAPAARGHEDHPRGADRRHVLGVVAGARQDAAVAHAARLRRPLDRAADVGGGAGERYAPVVLELIADAFALARVADGAVHEWPRAG